MAGDLSSHLYNAWLARQISAGRAPGLTLDWKSNNVLFDLALGKLMVWGPRAAERIAVPAAVLIFFWGAFLYIRPRRPRDSRGAWRMAPCLAMLAYGWVFHMGFFNFYLSLGLCLGAMALARRGGRWAAAGVAAMLVTAYMAHALPVFWSAALWVYERLALSIRPRRRGSLTIGALAGLAFVGLAMAVLCQTRRDGSQFLSAAGADQFWVYGKRYLWVVMAVSAAWVYGAGRLIRRRGAARLLLDIRFQQWAICAAAAVLLPGGVLLPGHHAGLDYIPERMSLGGAVLLCALIASVPVPRLMAWSTAAAAMIFFAFLYADDRALNRVAEQTEQRVAQLPPGRRVIGELADPEGRIRSLLHVVDRACIGRCFSYANYEPSSAEFRVRARTANPFVVADYGDSLHMQNGGYIVQARDLPLYGIVPCAADGTRICIQPLPAGARVFNTGLRLAAIRGG